MKNYSVLLTYKKKRLFGSIEKNLSIKTKAQTHEEAKINALKDSQESMKGFTLYYCEIQEIELIKEFFPLEFSEPKPSEPSEPKFEFVAPPSKDDDYNPLNDLREMFPLPAKQQLKRGRPPLVKKPLVKKTFQLVKGLPKISSGLNFHSALINKSLSREDLSNGMRLKIKNLERKEALYEYYVKKDRPSEATNIKKEIDKMDSWISRKITLFNKDYYEEQKKVAFRLNEIKKNSQKLIDSKDILLQERYNTLVEIYNPKSLSKSNKKVKLLLDDCMKKIKK
jgi:hypothetical protein